MKVDGDINIVSSTFLCLDTNPPDPLNYKTNK